MENIHGILQARVLEWVAVPFTRGSSQPREWTRVSHIAGSLFTVWATREALVEENRSKSSQPWVNHYFLLDTTAKAQVAKKKKDKLGFIKIKKLLYC